MNDEIPKAECKCENCGSPATHTGIFSEGGESSARVNICRRCAVVLKFYLVRPIEKVTDGGHKTL